MAFVEDGSLSLASASNRLVGDGYLASTRTGGNQGASAIVTDADFANRQDGAGPDFTFETWLRVPEQFSTDQWIFSKYAEGGDTGWIALDIRAGTLRPEVVISGQRLTLDNPIEYGEWVHLAATRAGSSYALYLNGVPAKTGTCRTTGFSASNAAAPVKLLNAGSNQSFGGDVKEMRIWNVARTAEQIAAYYDKKATGVEEGLIGCWHMDEGYGSKVRNAATGAEQSVAVGGMGLVRGSCLVTTGPRQTLVTDARLTTTDFTLEAWVRDDSVTRGGNGRGYVLSQFQSGKDWVSLCFNGPNNQKPGLRISSNKFFESSKAVEKGRWFHLAGTREGTTVKVYLDGELVNTSTYDGALGVPGANLTFFDLAGSGAGHVGGIREARAWNYAQTQAQIQQTMCGGLAGNEEGLVGWWPFDQDASATRVLNRRTNDIGKYVPTGAVWESDGSPLLALPDLGGEAEQAANFGGGWFSVARTGMHVDATDFTFEAWVRPDAHPFDQSYLFAQYKMGYMFRCNPAVRFCLQAVRDGLLGDVVHAEADMNFNATDPAYARYVSSFRAGVFYNLVCHEIDLLVAMMKGDLARATISVGDAPGDPPGSRTRCAALLEWPESTAFLRACSRVPQGVRRRLRVEGSNGTLELQPIECFSGRPLKVVLHLARAAGPYVAGLHELEFPPQTDRYAGLFLELAAIVRGERPNPVELYDHDLRVHDACLPRFVN